MKGPAAVIFDMDGVLVETEPIYVQICQDLFRKFGAEISRERLLSYVGIPAHRMWSELGDDFGLKYSVDEMIRREKTEQHDRFFEMNAIPMVSGVADFIEKLQRSDIAMGVASSSSRDIIRILLTKTGLSAYFKTIISGEDVEQGKPAPDIFLKACAGLNRKPADCVVIEDSPHGIRGAKRAGMKAVGFANPNSGSHDLSRADLVIDGFSLENIKKIIKLLEPGV
jgi:HAD superfamily hydrolase (TIGR01509 family)